MPGNHDVGEVLADAAPQRERHRRRGRRGGGADFVDEVGLDAPHQIDRAVEHRPAGRKALARIVADLRIERDLPARKQEMRRRLRRQIGAGERRVAHILPGGRRRGIDRGRRARRRRAPRPARVSVSCGWSSAIQVMRLPKKSCPSRRSTGAGLDIERRGMHALIRAVDRREPQHMARIGDRRRVVIDRRPGGRRRSCERLPCAPRSAHAS